MCTMHNWWRGFNIEGAMLRTMRNIETHFKCSISCVDLHKFPPKKKVIIIVMIIIRMIWYDMTNHQWTLLKTMCCLSLEIWHIFPICFPTVWATHTQITNTMLKVTGELYYALEEVGGCGINIRLYLLTQYVQPTLFYLSYTNTRFATVYMRTHTQLTQC